MTLSFAKYLLWARHSTDITSFNPLDILARYYYLHSTDGETRRATKSHENPNPYSKGIAKLIL